MNLVRDFPTSPHYRSASTPGRYLGAAGDAFLSAKALVGILDDPYAGERFERRRNEITARLVALCSHLSPKEFHLLMDGIAREEVLAELRLLTSGS